MAKLIPKVTSLFDLRAKAQVDERYLKLAMAAAENLGGRNITDLASAMQWLRINADETSEKGVVGEVNFCQRPHLMTFSDNAHRDNELEEMRQYATAEAEEAGLDENQTAAVVDASMSAYWEVDEVIDRDHFEDMVASVVQGVANP